MDCIIAYASQTLTKSEKNYDAHKLEFLALKWSVTERFHEYLYGGHFEMYMDNNPLTYILTTAKSRCNWTEMGFQSSYRSGKVDVEADALSRIPWENTQVNHLEPLIVNTMLQSKLGTKMGIPDVYLQLILIQKSMVVDIHPSWLMVSGSKNNLKTQILAFWFGC